MLTTLFFSVKATWTRYFASYLKKLPIVVCNLKISMFNISWSKDYWLFFLTCGAQVQCHLSAVLQEVLSDTGCWFLNKNFVFWQSMRLSQIIYELLCSRTKLIQFWRNPWTIFCVWQCGACFPWWNYTLLTPHFSVDTKHW